MENIEKTKEELELERVDKLVDERIEFLNKQNIDKKPIYSTGEQNLDLNEEFKSFLGEVKIKSGVTVPIPQQYVPEIVPTVGNWGVKPNCNYAGRLDSTVLNITRSISGGVAYWQSITGGGTSTTISSTAIAVNMDCLVAKVPIYDYQINTKGFDVLNYVSSEINKAIPKAEDIQILTGTGSPFTGIYGDSDVNTVAMSATGAITNLALADLRNMVSSINGAYRTSDLKWYVDQTEEQTIFGVCDANNRITDVTNGVTKILGYEVVPVSPGVLNGSTVSTTSSKHFILANLKEAIDVADQGLKVEAIRTTHGQTDYFFYNFEAFGIRQPKAACVLKLHA